MKLQDYYDILGVSRDAGADAIKHAYRAQVLRWHPDRHAGAAKTRAAARFKEISEAYETLSDAPSRRQYDDSFVADGRANERRRAAFRGGAERRAAPPERSPEGFDEGFADFFSNVYGGAEQDRAQDEDRGNYRTRGRDVEAECSLGVQQVIAGGSVNLDVPVRVECETCLGEGHVADALAGERTCTGCTGTGVGTESRAVAVPIPAQVHDGMEIVLAGMGGDGAFGGEPGDMRVTLRVRSDAIYRVDGADLSADLPVAPWEAVDGTRVEVRAPTGVIRVSVPATPRSGLRLRVAGNGLRRADGSRGDLYLSVRCELPGELTARQIELLRAAGAGGAAPVRGGARVVPAPPKD